MDDLGTPEPTPAGSPLKRAKLWELKDKHHCPVIGTCLSSDEVEKFARDFFFAADWNDAFALHTQAVNFASQRNVVSRAIDKHLERKYRIQISRFEQARNDSEVLALWHEHFTRGEVAGALWAALTHKAASDETRQQIHADVHMHAHQSGAGQSAEARRLAQENITLKAALEKQRMQQSGKEAGLREQLQQYKTELDRLRPASQEVAKLQARIDTFESGSAMMNMGRKLLSLQAANEELIITAQRGSALEKTLRVAHDQAQLLARECVQLTAERDALERLLLAGEADEGGSEDCDGVCAACEPTVKKRCVLCVGGRSSLLAQYRALAGRLGIRLIHHDGGLEEALSRLPDMINGADAVICPTDCVSHAAYYQLKRQCKRSGKPCLLFKGAGVSGFAVALARLSSGRVSLAGAPPTLG